MKTTKAKKARARVAKSTEDLPAIMTAGAIPLRATFDRASGHGFMFMTFADCAAKVMDGEQEIGEVCGTIGGGVRLTHRATDTSWYISPSALWDALVGAIEAADKAVVENNSHRRSSDV